MKPELTPEAQGQNTWRLVGILYRRTGDDAATARKRLPEGHDNQLFLTLPEADAMFQGLCGGIYMHRISAAMTLNFKDADGDRELFHWDMMLGRSSFNDPLFGRRDLAKAICEDLLRDHNYNPRNLVWTPREIACIEGLAEQSGCRLPESWPGVAIQEEAV